MWLQSAKDSSISQHSIHRMLPCSSYDSFPKFSGLSTCLRFEEGAGMEGDRRGMLVLR